MGCTICPKSGNGVAASRGLLGSSRKHHGALTLTRVVEIDEKATDLAYHFGAVGQK